MKRQRGLWLWLLALLMATGYIVPYTLLSGVERWNGAFLFWLLFGVAVWLVLSVTVLRWTATADAVDPRESGDRP